MQTFFVPFGTFSAYVSSPLTTEATPDLPINTSSIYSWSKTLEKFKISAKSHFKCSFQKHPLLKTRKICGFSQVFLNNVSRCRWQGPIKRVICVIGGVHLLKVVNDHVGFISLIFQILIGCGSDFNLVGAEQEIMAVLASWEIFLITLGITRISWVFQNL